MEVPTGTYGPWQTLWEGEGPFRVQVAIGPAGSEVSVLAILAARGQEILLESGGVLVTAAGLPRPGRTNRVSYRIMETE